MNTLIFIGIVSLFIGLAFFYGNKPVTRKEDEDEAETQKNEEFEEADTQPVTRNEQVLATTSNKKIQKRQKLKNFRNRPSTNHRFRSRHGYHNGLDIEDIWLYMWLLDGFDWDEDSYSYDDFESECLEWDIEGIDGASRLTFVDGVVTFFNDSDVAVLSVEQGVDGLTARDLVETTLFYFVDSAEEVISIEKDGEIESMSFVNGEWTNETERNNENDVMDSVQDTIEDVAVAAASVYVASEIVEEASSFVEEHYSEPESSSNDNDSSNSSVDSDTSY